MKNILIICTFFAFWTAMILFVVYFETQMFQQKSTSEVNVSSGEILESQEEIQEEIEPDVVRSKIDIIKKRLADKGIIIEGDSYYRNNQLSLALKKYLEFYKKNPNDPLILEKIAMTYFEMKKFWSSLNYLEKLSPLPESQKEIFALSLLYSQDLQIPENRTQIEETFQENIFSEEEMFYYTTSLKCIWDFHACKVDFQNYFGSGSTETSSTGSTKSTLPVLKNIGDALRNYENFQVDDISLKNAYLIWALYHNKLYPISIILWEMLLQEKPGYKPILKIVAQSYYELGKYENARNTLWDFYVQDASQADVSYMLGIIHEKLKDYVLSNIHLSKALELWYTPSIDVRRQLIHNLYILENDEAMLEAFKNLIEQESTIEATDLGLAIYYHILHDKMSEAQQWSKKGQELFPENGDFYAYEWWILRESGNLEEALPLLQWALGKDQENPFLLINIAYTTQALWKNWISSVYFKKVIEVAPGTQWALQAEKELESISQNEVF